MAAIALAPKLVMAMPNNQYPPHDQPGFTIGDRDNLNKVVWQLEMISKQMMEFDRRVVKLEDGRAHQKEFDEFRKKSEDDRRELREAILAMQLRLATVGGALLALAYIEPILMKLFWH